MKNIKLQDLKEKNYYLVYGRNWLTIVQLIDYKGNLCDVMYLQHGAEIIETFSKKFLIHLDLEQNELYELSDTEIYSQIFAECI